jgi:hypothetical protein
MFIDQDRFIDSGMRVSARALMIGLFMLGCFFYGLLGVEFDFVCDIVEFLVGGV